MDWIDAIKPIAIGLAAIGGAISLAAFVFSRRSSEAPDNKERVHALYLGSYICMSLSIFFVALNGLLR